MHGFYWCNALLCMFVCNMQLFVCSYLVHAVFWSYEVSVQRGTCHMCTDWRPRNLICGFNAWHCFILLLLFFLYLLCCNLYLKMHVGLKSAWELVFVLFVNVPTLNKTFDLIWFSSVAHATCTYSFCLVLFMFLC